MLSGIFLEDLQTPFAGECENITGASLTAIPCFIPWKSLVIPPIALGCTDTKIIPFLKKLEVESVDFRIMVNLSSKIRKGSHKNKTGLRAIIDCH